MEKEHSIWERMKERTVQDSQVTPFQPIIEITGHRRVLIENHRGVVTYGKEKIIVKVNYGCVCVCGSRLELTRMSKEQLIIFGDILSISLHRRDKT